MRQLKGLILFAAAAIFFSSCGSSAHIEKDQSVNLNRYKTYTWIDKENKEAMKNSIPAENLKNAVDEQLQKNGWREVNTNPDVLLSYDLLVEKSAKQQSDPVYSQPYTRLYYNPYTRRYGTLYYPSQFLGYDNYTVPVKEGTVSISMIDARTDKTIWQGWTTNELYGNHFTSKEVEKMSKSIFKKFDAAK